MKNNSNPIIADAMAAEKRRRAFNATGTYNDKPPCRPLINIPALARFFRVPEYVIRTAHSRGELPADFSISGPLWDPIYLEKTIKFFIAAVLRRDDIKTAEILAEACAKIPPRGGQDTLGYTNNQFWLNA